MAVVAYAHHWSSYRWCLVTYECAQGKKLLWRSHPSPPVFPKHWHLACLAPPDFFQLRPWLPLWQGVSAQPIPVLNLSLTSVAQASAPSCCKGASWGHGHFPLSLLPPRGLGAILIFLFSFLFLPTRLCRDLSCRFGCIGDLLPAFNWYSVRIVPHVRCIFDVFIEGRQAPHSSTLPS